MAYRKTIQTTVGKQDLYKDGKCLIELHMHGVLFDRDYTINGFPSFYKAAKLYKQIIEYGYPKPSLWVNGAQVVGY